MSTPRDYTLAEIQAGLISLAAHAGNAGPASRALAEQGIAIPVSTLRTWLRTRREEYDEIREKYGDQLEAEIARSLRESIAYTTRVAMKAVAVAEERLDLRKDINPAQTAASLARVVGTNTDKLLALTGRPTVITEHRSAEEILRPLIERGVLSTVTTTEGDAAAQLPAPVQEAE